MDAMTDTLPVAQIGAHFEALSALVPRHPTAATANGP